MPVEEIKKQIEEQTEIIANATRRISELSEKMALSEAEEYDWICVKSAAELIGVSVPVIYQKINSNKLTCRHINSKKFVKRSEVIKLDDR